MKFELNEKERDTIISSLRATNRNVGNVMRKWKNTMSQETIVVINKSMLDTECLITKIKEDNPT
jgi:hypothetical protein